MKMFKKSYLPYILLIIIFGSIPLLWFKENCIINGGDINFPLNPVKELRDRLFAWYPYYNGGLDNCINFGSLPFCLIKVCFYSITNSIIWTEKLTFTFWFILIGIAILIFTNELYPKKYVIARISAVLFYIANLYQFTIWRNVNITSIVSLATIPIIMTLIIKVFKLQKKKYFLMLWPVSILFGITSINPPVFILNFVLLAFFILCLIYKNKKYKSHIKLSFILLTIIIAINSYSIIPLIYKHITSKEKKETIIEKYNAIRYLATQSRHSSFTNVIRLMGNSEFYYDWKGDPYYPAFKHFKRKRNQILGFILPFLALIGALMYKKEWYIKFFSGIAIAGIILGMGIHWPMTKIYLWLFENFPLFWLYRSPWLKFSFLTVLGYSILAGTGCQFLYNLFKKYKTSLLIPLSIWLIYLYFIHPFLLGKMFTDSKDHKFLKPTRIQIPEYIYDFSNWANKQEGDFNILLLPDEKLSIYKWGYMGITDIPEMLLNKGILHREYGERGMDTDMSLLYKDIIDKLYKGETHNLPNLFSSARIKYICQRNDFQYDFYGDTDSPQFIKNILKKQRTLKFLQNFGEWDVYMTLKNPSPLIEIMDSENKNYKITATIKKKNPAHYEITVKDFKDKLQSPIIIFRENFNENWKVYVKCNKGKSTLKLKKHHKYENYANAWTLEGWNGKGLNLCLFYLPQILFYLGLVITSITLLVLILIYLN